MAAWPEAPWEMWHRGSEPAGAPGRAVAFEPLVAGGMVLPRKAPTPNRAEPDSPLRPLHDVGAVIGHRAPNRSEMDTYWRLQYLAYLAQCNFGHTGLMFESFFSLATIVPIVPALSSIGEFTPPQPSVSTLQIFLVMFGFASAHAGIELVPTCHAYPKSVFFLKHTQPCTPPQQLKSPTRAFVTRDPA